MSGAEAGTEALLKVIAAGEPAVKQLESVWLVQLVPLTINDEVVATTAGEVISTS